MRPKLIAYDIGAT